MVAPYGRMNWPYGYVCVVTMPPSGCPDTDTLASYFQ